MRFNLIKIWQCIESQRKVSQVVDYPGGCELFSLPLHNPFSLFSICIAFPGQAGIPTGPGPDCTHDRWWEELKPE